MFAIVGIICTMVCTDSLMCHVVWVMLEDINSYINSKIRAFLSPSITKIALFDSYEPLHLSVPVLLSYHQNEERATMRRIFVINQTDGKSKLNRYMYIEFWLLPFRGFNCSLVG